MSLTPVGRKNKYKVTELPIMFLHTNIFEFDILHFHKFKSYLKIVTLLNAKLWFSIVPERKRARGERVE